MRRVSLKVLNLGEGERKLTPRAKYSVPASEPRYAPVKGSRSGEVMCLKCARGPCRIANLSDEQTSAMRTLVEMAWTVSPDHEQYLYTISSPKRRKRSASAFGLRRRQRPLTLPSENETCGAVQGGQRVSLSSSIPQAYRELPRLDGEQRQSDEEGQHEAYSGAATAQQEPQESLPSA